MRLSLFSFAFISCLFISSLHAQTLQWQRCMGGSNLDNCSWIRPTSDHGFIICGYTLSVNGDVTMNHGQTDAWLIKTDSNGLIEWQRCYGGSNYDYGSAALQTADGGYIMAGSASSVNGDVTANHGSSDVWLVKLDDTGHIQWQKTYGGTGLETVRSMVISRDGSFVMAGTTSSPNNGDVTGFHGSSAPDWWILKVNDTGTLVWQKALGGTGDDEAYSIAETQDSGYIITGMTMSANGDVTHYHGGTSEGGDCWVAALDKHGALVWQKTYGGSLEEQGFSIFQKASGNYILGASTMSSDGDVTGALGQADAWLLELNDTGGIVWQKNYGTSGTDYCTSLLPTPDNGYVFGGWNGNDWIVKLDAAGTVQWQHSYGGSAEDVSWDIALASDGGYVLTGSTNTPNDGDVSGDHGNQDIWTIKVQASSAITDPTGGTHIGIYPNPSHNLLHIDGISSRSIVSLYNIQGQLLRTIVAGNGTLSVADLAPGLYILKTDSSATAYFVKE